MNDPKDAAGRPDDEKEPAKGKDLPVPKPATPEAAIIKKVEALVVEIVEPMKVPVEFNHPSNPVGRPTKYRDSMCQQVITFIKERVAMGMCPTKEGLAYDLMIDIGTLADWRKKIPEFNQAVKVLNTIQADILIHKGLTKKYDSFLVQFLLKNNHGYHDRMEIDARVEIGTQIFIVGGQEIKF